MRNPRITQGQGSDKCGRQTIRCLTRGNGSKQQGSMDADMRPSAVRNAQQHCAGLPCIAPRRATLR
eukprot:CAMPEP_0175610370 /NCGR_PEP_ID=MMETSP0096-20121207/62751_1 /TAXON_ID=311494 /ORGANISM="Alexandrium monilatum, Strain CCMP3105" /LENGTH=65 /DNA_ID=CAMNT_0016915339 /DNA_START=35 /DNA_END=228 /DNA_ORIENTATION=+